MIRMLSLSELNNNNIKIIRDRSSISTLVGKFNNNFDNILIKCTRTHLVSNYYIIIFCKKQFVSRRI